jgi:hypothetical protein
MLRISRDKFNGFVELKSKEQEKDPSAKRLMGFFFFNESTQRTQQTQ